MTYYNLPSFEYIFSYLSWSFCSRCSTLLDNSLIASIRSGTSFWYETERCPSSLSATASGRTSRTSCAITPRSLPLWLDFSFQSKVLPLIERTLESGFSIGVILSFQFLSDGE